ncbi:pseudouridine synthase [Escherichia coli]
MKMIILVLNKPSGTAVHGGSGLSFGVIEVLAALRPEARFLELVHRLDRDTSGVLLVAKNARRCVLCMSNYVKKGCKRINLALVRGQWQSHVKSVQAPLLKYFQSRPTYRACESGRQTVGKTLQKWKNAMHLPPGVF